LASPGSCTSNSFWVHPSIFSFLLKTISNLKPWSSCFLISSFATLACIMLNHTSHIPWESAASRLVQKQEHEIHWASNFMAGKNPKDL
jgi:hypothetical protein